MSQVRARRVGRALRLPLVGALGLLWMLSFGSPEVHAQPAQPPVASGDPTTTDDGEASAPANGDVVDPDETTGAGRSATTFQPADATAEETPGYTLMVAAYLVLWVLIGLYALLLWRRQRNIGAELAGLRSRLDALDEATREQP